ncbi:MAG: hypothetical protein ACI30N_05430 [Muribaculaceae bacterium]
MRLKVIIASLVASVIFSISACSNGKSEKAVVRARLDSFPDPVRPIVGAVMKNDREKFASLILYPLVREYPLHDINSREEMLRYYSVIADDSLHNVIAGSRPADWDQYGWRGWSLLDGQYVWVDDSIYSIPYMSNAERALRDTLVARDLASLSAPLGKGWTPECCFRQKDGKHIYRIDRSAKQGVKPTYRLLMYTDTDKMRGEPARNLTGYREAEGSMVIITYYFSTPEGGQVIVTPEPVDSPYPTLEIEGQGIASGTSMDLVKAYWLDMLPPDGDSKAPAK